MSKVSLHPICIKNQDENNNILGLDTSELRFGSVQNLYLELETLPLTELFRSHHSTMVSICCIIMLVSAPLLWMLMTLLGILFKHREIFLHHEIYDFGEKISHVLVIYLSRVK